MRKRKPLALLSLFLLVSIGVFAGVDVNRKSWAGQIITFHSHLGKNTKKLRQVIRQWDKALPVTFQEVGKREDPNLVIRYSEKIKRPECGKNMCLGWSSTIGPNNETSVIYMKNLLPSIEHWLLAHELGHFLGLNHLADDCSLMTSKNSAFTKCLLLQNNRSVCRLSEASENELNELYGVKNVGSFCKKEKKQVN